MSHLLPEKTFELTVIAVPDGIIQGCKKCGRAYSVGQFVIKVTVHFNHIKMSMYRCLAPETPVMCCGEQKQAMLTFETVDEVNAALQKIQEILNRDEGTSELPLVAVPSALSGY